MRKGRTSFHYPPFISDLGVGEFADSGTRGYIRFLVGDKSIGAYSLRPFARSRKLNRGAIVKISDSEISYFTTALSDRKDGVSSKKEVQYGPALPHSQNPSRSGEVSVTASTEKVSNADRKAVDDVLLTRDVKGYPSKYPFFWTHLDRITNWLMVDTGPVFYQVTGETEAAYRKLLLASQRMEQRGGCYIDHSERYISETEMYKGNFGGNRLADRKQMSVGPQHALHFHLNFVPVTFEFVNGRFYFLPDELVIADSLGNCTLVPYSEISYAVNDGTHANIAVPSWCVPVSYAWRYMNKDGGPDRRFNDNYQVPHYQAWEFDITFPDGRIDTAFADFEALSQFTTALDKLIALSSKRKVVA